VKGMLAMGRPRFREGLVAMPQYAPGRPQWLDGRLRPRWVSRRNGRHGDRADIAPKPPP